MLLMSPSVPALRYLSTLCGFLNSGLCGKAFEKLQLDREETSSWAGTAPPSHPLTQFLGLVFLDLRTKRGHSLEGRYLVPRRKSQEDADLLSVTSRDGVLASVCSLLSRYLLLSEPSDVTPLEQS